MRKILIVFRELNDKILIEQALSEIVENGGELFFAGSSQDGLEVLEKEKPPLIFVDESLIGESLSSWREHGSYLVVIGAKKHPIHGVDTLIKPLGEKAVLEKCQRVWGVLSDSFSDLPPM